MSKEASSYYDKSRKRFSQGNLSPRLIHYRFLMYGVDWAKEVPQWLLGPTPFPFDRLMAILGSLLEENDVDGEESRAPADDVFHTPGEHTDMEIMRVGVYTSVVELASMWLLHRTPPSDTLEGPPMYKSGISRGHVGIGEGIGRFIG
ncbi:hypothetical protein F5887DRAFT_918148 [Amanita rubescens]|nr:hypothetical protein F5887DRAFT_918148 [Amanita rubescens]